VLNLAVAFLEALNPTSGVNQFLLAGEERVAGGTDFGVDLFEGRTGLERVSAQTFDRNLVVHRVDSFFHLFLLQIGAARKYSHELP
jgi:hypothetical protein